MCHGAAKLFRIVAGTHTLVGDTGACIYSSYFLFLKCNAYFSQRGLVVFACCLALGHPLRATRYSPSSLSERMAKGHALGLVWSVRGCAGGGSSPAFFPIFYSLTSL